MYLWSIDIEAVLTAMSCFRLLCDEADVRCGADEMAVTQILPNYSIYAELAAASTVLTTGRPDAASRNALTDLTFSQDLSFFLPSSSLLLSLHFNDGGLRWFPVASCSF